MSNTLSRIARALPLLALAGCAARRPSPAESSVTVLVYNVHAGKDAAGVDNLARVAAVVRDAGADVVLLQEVDRGTRRSGGVDQPAALARLTGYHASFGRSLDYDGGTYGIAVLSRWPVRRDTTVSLPVDPPQQRSGGSYEPRAAHWVTLDAPGGPLAVVDTHLDASRDDGYRRQEIRTVIAIAERARAGGVPVLVGGDFNAEPGSAPHAAALAAGLRDAWLECGRGQALTYPDGVPVKRIDYLWLSGATRCEAGRVIESRASDHRPVVFRVRVPRAR